MCLRPPPFSWMGADRLDTFYALKAVIDAATRASFSDTHLLSCPVLVKLSPLDVASVVSVVRLVVK